MVVVVAVLVVMAYVGMVATQVVVVEVVAVLLVMEAVGVVA